MLEQSSSSVTVVGNYSMRTTHGWGCVMPVMMTSSSKQHLNLLRRRKGSMMIKKTPKGWLVLNFDGEKLGSFVTFQEAKDCLAEYEKGLK
jgi:hypothetical protein